MSGLHHVIESLESRWMIKAQTAGAAELDFVLLYPLGSLYQTDVV